MEPYLSLDDPAGGARPAGTDGWPSERPEGKYLGFVDEGPDVEVEAGVGDSKMLRADIRLEVGVSRDTDAGFFGVRSSSPGFAKTLAKGDPLTGVASNELGV